MRVTPKTYRCRIQSSIFVLANLLKEIDFERRFQQVPPQAEPYRAALTAIDCSEFEIRRPLHGQRLFYSGKHHFHGIKYEFATRLEDGLCVWINGPVRGAAHDSTIVADLDTALQPGEEVVADLGYVGFRRAVLPKKRAPGGELTDADQQHNFRHRMVRANVEHYFSRVKSFSAFSSPWRNRLFLHKPALLVVCNPHNPPPSLPTDRPSLPPPPPPLPGRVHPVRLVPLLDVLQVGDRPGATTTTSPKLPTSKLPATSGAAPSTAPPPPPPPATPRGTSQQTAPAAQPATPRGGPTQPQQQQPAPAPPVTPRGTTGGSAAAAARPPTTPRAPATTAAPAAQPPSSLVGPAFARLIFGADGATPPPPGAEPAATAAAAVAPPADDPMHQHQHQHQHQQHQQQHQHQHSTGPTPAHRPAPSPQITMQPVPSGPAVSHAAAMAGYLGLSSLAVPAPAHAPAPSVPTGQPQPQQQQQQHPAHVPAPPPSSSAPAHVPAPSVPPAAMTAPATIDLMEPPPVIAMGPPSTRPTRVDLDETPSPAFSHLPPPPAHPPAAAAAAIPVVYGAPVIFPATTCTPPADQHAPPAAARVVVRLDIGGTRVETLATTLLAAPPGSLLHLVAQVVVVAVGTRGGAPLPELPAGAMWLPEEPMLRHPNQQQQQQLQQRQNEAIETGSSGGGGLVAGPTVFLDRDGALFRPILKWLRHGAPTSGLHPAPPVTQVDDLLEEAGFYGLEVLVPSILQVRPAP
ncbi:hypothetical protein PAPYR_6339 [Paratrimastix pyriformis]|uniref:DDE Tnp4 domain-containing protein n=1 Tax=Paratrimastix pyriformis TaxID=342808 RepID=A0ABQ8UMU0_9EUKA|nr:hypothetical protein PAPYR_6339 [Paratrimastix pyriformis]